MMTYNKHGSTSSINVEKNMFYEIYHAKRCERENFDYNITMHSVVRNGISYNEKFLD